LFTLEAINRVLSGLRRRNKRALTRQRAIVCRSKICLERASLSTLVRQNRDLRIDLFRGFALWCMFIDHLITSWLRAVTLKEFGFCDGAELFVLLSGLSAGMVYGRLQEREGVWAARLKILRRMVAIYRVHLIMFMLFVAEVGILVRKVNPPDLIDFLGLSPFGTDSYRAIINAVLLHAEPKFFDILPLYVVLLLMLATTLPLLRWPVVLLCGSLVLYVATRFFHLTLGVVTDHWFFNPLAWQAIFMVGVTAPYILERKEYWRGWDWFAVLFSIFGLFESQAKHLAHHVPAGLLLQFEVDKPSLHPFRLVAIVAWAWLGWRHIPVVAEWLRSPWASMLVLLGQHSLVVFAASVLLAVLGESILWTYPGLKSQVLVQGLGSVALVAVGAIAAWMSNPGRAADRPAQSDRADGPVLNLEDAPAAPS
jgi:hypothetical protein